MGFRITWDIPSIVQQVHKMRAEICSPYNDGFNQWMVKQDLYQLKHLVDEALDACPQFAGEEEWLKEQDQKRMWKAIKESK